MEADLRPSELGVVVEGAFQGAEVGKRTQTTSGPWAEPPYHLIGRLCEQGHCSGLLYGDLRIKKKVQIFKDKKIQTVLFSNHEKQRCQFSRTMMDFV